FFCQFSVLANNLPQNIKENLGINQFLDESLKEILNQPLKEKFALTPKRGGGYFFEGNLSLFQKQCLENNATACAY
ncbi:transcriptional regulator, partial [Campylobacter coli]|nr:transcriptional regulator [Campylobacter coli]